MKPGFNPEQAPYKLPGAPVQCIFRISAMRARRKKKKRSNGANDVPVTINTLTGNEIEALLEPLARLRVEVFREWPYLYDGSEAYEAEYLSRYLRSPGAVMVGAFDGGALIGAATGQPLRDEVDDIRRPYEAAGLDPAGIYYFAESVLTRDYRGRGIGHAFFDGREVRARELGFDAATFCAVIRPANHPCRPEGYRPLDPFWRKRGFAPVDGLTIGFDWPDVGETGSSRKALQVWLRRGLLR